MPLPSKASATIPLPPSSPSVARRLPDELIIDIFRNRVLSRTDLSQCALVSRRFVEPVNEILYSHLDVVITRYWHYSDMNDDDALLEWSEKSWKLLRTLMDNSKLATYIESIHFAVEGKICHGGGMKSRTPGLLTTPFLAFATLVRLGARKLKEISFGSNWIPIGEELKVVAEFDTIKNLRLDYNTLKPVDYEFLARQIPHLKELCCDSIKVPDIASVHLTRLEVIEVRHLRWGLPWNFKFLLANRSTLRILRVNLDFALEINYSLFPELIELELFEPDDVQGLFFTTDQKREELQSRCQKFWESLSRSPRLSTLSLSSMYEDSDYGSALFTQTNPSMRPIPTLKTLRFNDEIYLDWTNLILSSTIASTIHTVVLPEWYAPESATLVEENVVKFVGIASGGREVKFATKEGFHERSSEGSQQL
ncbi:F-box protein [Sporobolomyces salmoneus]|uniref:F-box protein n=1 Tax=Sporobolomyces salmoneus TaxID=183962 RepID=UPI0031782C3C